MQVVTSTSFAISSPRTAPRPGTVPGWPEIDLISSVLSIAILAASLLSLLDLHEEPFVLGCVGVWIHSSRRKQVHGIERGLAFVFGDAAIAPVNRNADLLCLLAVDHHRLNSTRHH